MVSSWVTPRAAAMARRATSYVVAAAGCGAMPMPWRAASCSAANTSLGSPWRSWRARCSRCDQVPMRSPATPACSKMGGVVGAHAGGVGRGQRRRLVTGAAGKLARRLCPTEGAGGCCCYAHHGRLLCATVRLWRGTAQCQARHAAQQLVQRAPLLRLLLRRTQQARHRQEGIRRRHVRARSSCGGSHKAALCQLRRRVQVRLRCGFVTQRCVQQQQLLPSCDTAAAPLLLRPAGVQGARVLQLLPGKLQMLGPGVHARRVHTLRQRGQGVSVTNSTGGVDTRQARAPPARVPCSRVCERPYPHARPSQPTCT